MHHSFGCFAVGWTLAGYSLCKLCEIDISVTLTSFRPSESHTCVTLQCTNYKTKGVYFYISKVKFTL